MKRGIADSRIVSFMSTTTSNIQKFLVEVMPESCTSLIYAESSFIIFLYGVNKKLKYSCLKSVRDSFFVMLIWHHNRKANHPDKSIPVAKSVGQHEASQDLRSMQTDINKISTSSERS